MDTLHTHSPTHTHTRIQFFLKDYWIFLYLQST